MEHKSWTTVALEDFLARGWKKVNDPDGLRLGKGPHTMMVDEDEIAYSYDAGDEPMNICCMSIGLFGKRMSAEREIWEVDGEVEDCIVCVIE